MFGHDTLSQEKHDDVTDSTSTGRPVCGSESTKRCVLTPIHVEEDQTRTVRPVLVDQKEEHEIDFRIPGLLHAVVKEAEHLRVQELVKKIENHPHREALQADLQQNNVYHPFSKKSKDMTRELGNVELFELCKTIPKVQCSHCLLYWNQGIVYCSCGQCLIESEPRRKVNKLRLDALSVPNYLIKKGPTHGGRHGKTKEQTEYHMAWNAWKRCCKKVDSQGEHFYRYSRSISHRCSLSWITTRNRMERTKVQRVGWICTRWPYISSHSEEKKRYQGQWYLTLNKAGKMGLWNFDLIFEPLSQWKIVYTTNQGTKLKSLSIQINTVDGIPLQAHRGGTSLNGIGNELISFF